MSNRPIVERIETPLHNGSVEQNVQGWERIGSLAGGVLMMGKGLRRGGLFGLVQLAIGGAVLARGITGHCAAKSLLEQSRSDLDSARLRVRRAGAELSALKDDADAAAKDVVNSVADSLKPTSH